MDSGAAKAITGLASAGQALGAREVSAFRSLSGASRMPKLSGLNGMLEI